MTNALIEIAAIDEFIAKTSHEFKTPLNSMINICQTLLARKSKRTVEEEKENLQLVIRMGYRLSSLVNDILDLEKMKQGMEPGLQSGPVYFLTTADRSPFPY